MKKLIVWMILSTFLLSGCVSGRMSGNPGAVVAGASIGGSVGSAIGGLIGENNHGWRGGYRGSAIGTIVGTVAGVDHHGLSFGRLQDDAVSMLYVYHADLELGRIGGGTAGKKQAARQKEQKQHEMNTFHRKPP